MLSEMEMYDQGTGASENLVLLNNQTYISSKEKGIFYSKYRAGDHVEKDDIVGHTTDEFGNIIAEYKSPKAGVILYKLATPPINVGDTVMCISSKF